MTDPSVRSDLAWGQWLGGRTPFDRDVYWEGDITGLEAPQNDTPTVARSTRAGSRLGRVLMTERTIGVSSAHATSDEAMRKVLQSWVVEEEQPLRFYDCGRGDGIFRVVAVPGKMSAPYTEDVDGYELWTFDLQWLATDPVVYSDDESTAALTLGSEVSVATVGLIPTWNWRWVITGGVGGCVGPRLRLFADDLSDVEGSARQLWFPNLTVDEGDVLTVYVQDRYASLADGTARGGVLRRNSSVRAPGWFPLRPHDDSRATGQTDNKLGFYVDSGTATGAVFWRDAYP